MKCAGTEVSPAGAAWQMDPCSAEHTQSMSAWNLFQSFTTRVKYISQLPPAITVVHFSLNLIFVPFPMVPPPPVFLQSEAIRVFHQHTLSIKLSVRLL